jgi:hypothetical protein
LENTNTDNAPDFVPFKDRAGIQLPDQYVIALEWTALKPSTPFEAVWGFNKAQNWDDFRNAAKNFHVPAQNLIYADTSGNIGYQMPGDVPIRKSGDGRFPVPGWTGQYDWTGFIPFDQLPYTYNPSEGYIVTANNQVAPNNYPYFITADWNYGFRANRIVNMIKSAPSKIDIANIQKMQGDDYDSNAETFVPLLQQMSSQFTGNDAAALNLLQLPPRSSKRSGVICYRTLSTMMCPKNIGRMIRLNGMKPCAILPRIQPIRSGMTKPPRTWSRRAVTLSRNHGARQSASWKANMGAI